jgi:hypothetical protein
MTEIRSYDYVNHAYERVRDALRTGALDIFRSATRAATSRAQSLAAELRVEIGGIDVATGIDIAVEGIEDVDSPHGPTTRMRLTWQAARRPQLFPLMDAVLSVYALTRTETQLDFAGRYDPPLGPLGTAIDAVAGRRIAEACVQRFVADVALHLRESLRAA